MLQNLTGIVLAGGLSTRMGRDKASLPWGEADLLHTVLACLAAVCAELIVVSNVPRSINLPARVIPDQYCGFGPLGGIHAGLAAAGHDYAFIAACDMPCVDSRAVACMAGLAAGYDVAVPQVNGLFHPLHAVYHKRCVTVIEDMLGAGISRISDLFPRVKTRIIGERELQPFSAGCAMLRNLNSPEDIADVKKYHE